VKREIFNDPHHCFHRGERINNNGGLGQRKKVGGKKGGIIPKGSGRKKKSNIMHFLLGISLREGKGFFRSKKEARLLKGKRGSADGWAATSGRKKRVKRRGEVRRAYSRLNQPRNSKEEEECAVRSLREVTNTSGGERRRQPPHPTQNGKTPRQREEGDCSYRLI